MQFKIDYASLWLEGNLQLFLCFTLYLRALFSRTSPRGLIFGGAIKWGFFCVTGLRGLYVEGLIFGILQYYDHFEAGEMHT